MKRHAKSITRLAAVSDIHGNLPALEAVLAEISRENVDLIVNLGDIVSGPLWPVETAEHLMAMQLPTLRGNHERQLLHQPRERMSLSDAFAAERISTAQRQWLDALPASLQLADDLLCCHGTPDSDLQYWLETVTDDFRSHGSRGVRMATTDEARARLGSFAGHGASLVLCGHTHMPRTLQIPGGPLVVNPGSVGLQAYDDGNPYTHVMEVGSPHARWALIERSNGGWSVQLRATAYDWDAAAERAEANGRGDWADALRSGFVGRFEDEMLANIKSSGKDHA